jgi:DNA uptake protein ComE-like DNA-binding protein
MIDLNRASYVEIAAAGVGPVLARAIALWQPYRCWDDLLLVGEVDDVAIEKLQQGFEILPTDDGGWAAPKPFKLSAGSRA